ncbi:hypothetical protein hmeg3_05795 [Herbaspirillum sp. meg3]|jgi:hypothetical protein|uniref:hypothetical protein n=1 Tax=Herbaspirillum sp. meg3 TaxID=2025949 RepID=UPI000B98C473|nr:hypothetical protein [Herbaspirillum sp. meg3]ASU37854.1 hypothetical protein hmeg3_05795 [Herbaspirillum sp. meg3]
MADSVFLKIEFYLLIFFSLVLPAAIFATMLLKRALARSIVLLFGMVLLVLAGIDIVLLKKLAWLARTSLSSLDDAFFNSEMSLCLYLLPAFLGGVGTNVISHILIRHLREAEDKFDREQPGHWR